MSLSLTVSQELEALDRLAQQKQRLRVKGARREESDKCNRNGMRRVDTAATVARQFLVSRSWCSSSGESATVKSELLPSAILALGHVALTFTHLQIETQPCMVAILEVLS